MGQTLPNGRDPIKFDLQLIRFAGAIERARGLLPDNLSRHVAHLERDSGGAAVVCFTDMGGTSIAVSVHSSIPKPRVKIATPQQLDLFQVDD